MPRDVVIVTRTAPDLAAFVTAGAEVAPDLRVRTLDGGAVTEVVDRAGVAVLSVGRPELLSAPDEVARLLPDPDDTDPNDADPNDTDPNDPDPNDPDPDPDPDPAGADDSVWWVEAWAPWGAHGDVGVSIARAFAVAVGGRCVVEDGS